MKDLVSLIAGMALLLIVLFMVHDAQSEEKDTQLIMERFNRVQILYDEGLRLYDEGSKYQGCYYLRMAVRESRWIGDEGQTLRQVEPVYEKTCKGEY